MNDITELQSHLFDTLKALKDKDNPMDIERAKAISDVGQTIINAAKTEIDFARVNGSVDSQFFKKSSRPALGRSLNNPDESEAHEPQQASSVKETLTGKLTTETGPTGLRIVQHKMK